MSITTISSREFNQDAGGAKKAAEKGPVVITDRGRPAHVLLSFEDYQKLLGKGVSLAEALAQKKRISRAASSSIPRACKMSRALSILTDVSPRYQRGVRASPA